MRINRELNYFLLINFCSLGQVRHCRVQTDKPGSKNRMAPVCRTGAILLNILMDVLSGNHLSQHIVENPLVFNVLDFNIRIQFHLDLERFF